MNIEREELKKSTKIAFIWSIISYWVLFILPIYKELSNYSGFNITNIYYVIINIFKIIPIVACLAIIVLYFNKKGGTKLFRFLFSVAVVVSAETFLWDLATSKELDWLYWCLENGVTKLITLPIIIIIVSYILKWLDRD